MALNRFQPWLLAFILQLLVVSTALAQEGVPAFAPGLFEDNDFQFFSQPDLTGYGSGDRAPTGWFGNVDYLVWAVSAPQVASVGAPHSRQVYDNNGAAGQANSSTPGFTETTSNTGTVNSGINPGSLFTTQNDSDTTGFLRTGIHSGARLDFGYIDEDTNSGWLFSGFRVNSLSQSTNSVNANMVLDDGSNTDTPGSMVQQAAVYSGIPGGPTSLPLLYGWIDQKGGGATGLQPDGFVDDVNRNNLYGPQGRDRGVSSGSVLSTGTTLSGHPTNEGAADTVTIPFGANGPPPGAPANGGAYQPIDYGDAVPLPVIFTSLKLQYKDWAYGAEASRLWRLGEGRKGGTWEVFAGARYLDYGDYFGGYAVGGILDASNWEATTENHIIGGQAGLRWRKKWSRMGFAFEARGTAGANFQITHLAGELGSHLTQLQQNPVTVFQTVTIPTPQVTPAPTTTSQLVFVTTQPNNPGGGPTAFRVNQPMNLNPTGFNVNQHKVTFSPIGELRANWSYQLFNSVSLTAGWTGIFVNGVGQASRQIEYAVPAFSLLNSPQHQTVVLTGLNIGLQFNR